MLYQFLLNFVDIYGFLNVFKYITFRTGLSLFTSLIIVLLIGGPFIRFFSNRKIVNPIRDDGPQDHIVKKIGTPTMGGVIILFGLLLSVLCWGDLSNYSVLFCISAACCPACRYSARARPMASRGTSSAIHRDSTPKLGRSSILFSARKVLKHVDRSLKLDLGLKIACSPRRPSPALLKLARSLRSFLLRGPQQALRPLARRVTRA